MAPRWWSKTARKAPASTTEPAVPRKHPDSSIAARSAPGGPSFRLGPHREFRHRRVLCGLANRLADNHALNSPSRSLQNSEFLMDCHSWHSTRPCGMKIPKEFATERSLDRTSGKGYATFMVRQTGGVMQRSARGQYGD